MFSIVVGDSPTGPDGASTGLKLRLTVLSDDLAISRLPARAGLPAWASPGKGAARGPLTSVSWTNEETTVVCVSALVPSDIPADRGWRALKVEGPLDLSLVGILAALARPLAEAGVPVFAISAYDTDYLLVRETSLGAAVAVLQAAEHTVS